MHTLVDKIPRWLLAIIPLVLLGGVLWLFVQFAPLHSLVGDLPGISCTRRFCLCSLVS